MHTRPEDTKPRKLELSVPQHIREELSREREASAHLRQLVTQNETTVQQLLTDTSQQISLLGQEKNSQIQQLQQQLADVRKEKEAQIQQLQLHLSDVRRDNERLHQGIGPNTSPSHSQGIEFWRVSFEEVQVRQEILGRGAWGVVSKGKFRGQKVAVKQVYPDILQQTAMDRIRREIRTWHKCSTQTWYSSSLQ